MSSCSASFGIAPFKAVRLGPESAFDELAKLAPGGEAPGEPAQQVLDPTRGEAIGRLRWPDPELDDEGAVSGEARRCGSHWRRVVGHAGDWTIARPFMSFGSSTIRLRIAAMLV
jgi:hypothetical protein